MMKFCPVTRKIRHQFNAQTHRCECGAWERGHAPKKVCVKPRGECQICEREQARDASGNMVHHGYTRPGCGFIQGDCYGVGHEPYKATDALAKYLKILNDYIIFRQMRLNSLPHKTEIDYTYTTGRGVNKQTHTVTVKLGDTYRYDATLQVSFPSFAELVTTARRKLESEIREATAERQRVTDRIEKATAV